MNPKPGSPVSLVPPASPAEAAEAVQADPGKEEKAEFKAQEKKPPTFKPVKMVEVVPSWIEIEMVDEQGQPVPGVRYRVVVPDGSAAEGTLDAKGFARVEGFEKGDCKISFPDLDQDAWEEA
jgi:type VI secretion system secreted protein VgrG